MEYNFDDIRPYRDNEVREKIRVLLKDPVFDTVLMHMFKFRLKTEIVKMKLRMIKTTEQLQKSFIYNLVHSIIDKTSDGLTGVGLEKLQKDKAYLFISNHRDIILDAALLNILIVENGMNTTQIAIGNNLLLYDWIEHAVKLNRAFIIKRNLPPRELMEASGKVSRYIRKSVTADNFSVALPADWRPGDDVIIPTAGSCGVAKQRMGNKKDMKCYDWFFCTRKLSKKEVEKNLHKKK